MTLYKRTLGIVGVGLLLSGTQLFAAQMNAKEVVSKAYAQIGSMDRYAFSAVIGDNETIDGKTTTYKQNVSVKIDRPGNLRVDTKGDIKNRSNYLHNGQFTMIDHGFGYYTQLNTPETIGETIDYLYEKFGIRTPLSTLIYSDMGKRIKFKKNQYFGTVNVAGVECDYVAFSNGAKEIHLWITTGDTPLVKTFSIINGDTRINATLVWDTDPKISESDFVFKAPKGASKISVSSAN
jgi:hypothetical protein